MNRLAMLVLVLFSLSASIASAYGAGAFEFGGK
jgi:hypothetical protein